MFYFRNFLRAGHPPTLAAAFFYLTFTFVVWVLNGAMAPFISEAYHLTPAQKGLMLSIPIVAGALMRFPLGVLAQYIGRKRATLVEMGLIAVAMLYGYLHVHSFGDLLAMGVLLGWPAQALGWPCLSALAGSLRSTRVWQWDWSAPAMSALRSRCWWRRRWRRRSVGKPCTQWRRPRLRFLPS